MGLDLLLIGIMDREKIEREHLASLFHFAWALTGSEAEAIKLARMVLADTTWHAASDQGKHATDVALFATAYRLFTRGEPLPIPPAHERVALLKSLSAQYASELSTSTLFTSFRELELPQRAALILFYTAKCSIGDIAIVLHRDHEEAVEIISRGKGEWLHILEKRGPMPSGNAE